jgi:hypothetical protein
MIMEPTSIQAHEAIKPIKPTLKSRVLMAIDHYGRLGAISSDVVSYMRGAGWDYDQSSITTRYKELAAEGRIIYGRETRKNTRGRAQRVMFANPGQRAIPTDAVNESSYGY